MPSLHLSICVILFSLIFFCLPFMLPPLLYFFYFFLLSYLHHIFFLSIFLPLFQFTFHTIFFLPFSLLSFLFSLSFLFDSFIHFTPNFRRDEGLTGKNLPKRLTIKNTQSKRFYQAQWKNLRMSLIHVIFFAVFWAPYTIHQTW